MKIGSYQLRCAISGVPLGKFVTGLNSLAILKEVQSLGICHPQFMRDSYSLAADLQANWWEDANDYQRGLWMLAALNSLQVLVVRKPQMPPHVVLHNQFPERVASLLAWSSALTLRRINLPRFVLDESSDLLHWSGFRAWLAAAEKVYSEWEEGIRTNERKRRRLNGAKKLVHNIQLHSAGYRKSLPVQLLWNFASADIPDSLLRKQVKREIGTGKFETRSNEDWWQDMFCHPRIQDDMRFVKADVEELEEVIYSYMDENFLGSSQSAAVTARLRDLAEAYQNTADTFRILSAEDAMNDLSREAQASLVLHDKVQTMIAEGITKPEPGQFATHTQYLVALAKWKMVEAITRVAPAPKAVEPTQLADEEGL